MEIIYSSKYIRILGKVYYITLPSILYYFAKYIILLCQVYYIMDRLCIVGSFLLDDFRNKRLRKPDALLDYIDSKVMDDGNP